VPALRGRLSTRRQSCEFDGMGLLSVDAFAHAVELAEDQAARVIVVRHELDTLIEHGSIATLKRADMQRPVPAPTIISPRPQARAGRRERHQTVLRPLRESVA
jgi:hypothetical protein